MYLRVYISNFFAHFVRWAWAIIEYSANFNCSIIYEGDCLVCERRRQKNRTIFISLIPINIVGTILESLVDERGRVLIPQQVRENLGFAQC